MQIEYPVVFAGEDKTKGTNENKIFGARDFLEETLRVRTAQGYNDAQTMQWVIKALKDAALKWFNKSYLRHVGMDDKTTAQDVLKTDFSIFEKAFRNRYGVPNIRRHYLFDAVKAQANTEKPADYLDRITNVTLDHSKFIEEEAKKYHSDPPPYELDYATEEMEDGEFTEAQKRIALRLIIRNRKQMAEDTMELQQAHITKAFFSNGLKDTHLKAAAQKAFDESPTGDITTMYNAVQQLYHRMKPSTSVNAIEDGIEEDAETNEPQVEAVKAKKKPNNKKQKQKPAKAATTNATPSDEECTHCGKRGHKALVCYSRIRQLERHFNDTSNGKQLEKPTRTSAVALNCKGKW